MTIEGLRLRFRNKVYLPLTRNYRRRFLQNEDFTIISNNCWGGLYMKVMVFKNSLLQLECL